MANKENTGKPSKRSAQTVRRVKAGTSENGIPNKTATGSSKDRSNQTIAVATVAMALATIVAGVIGWLQWRTLGTATDAAVTSADAAMEAVASADRNAQRQLRAYLHFEEIHIDVVRDASGQEVFVFTPSFKNFGNTPAKIVRSIVSTRVVTDGNVDAIKWPSDLKGEEQSMHIAPGLGAPINELEVPLKDAKRLGKEYRLVYRFYVRYTTVFDDLGPRETAQVIEIATRGDPVQAIGPPAVKPSKIFRFLAHSRGSFAN